MIIIEIVNKARKTGTLMQPIIYASADAAVKGLANTISPTLEGKECIHHPGQTSTLVLEINNDLKMSTRKTEFCCQEFADAIQIIFGK